MAVHETDVCIIGGGITSAMLAQKLTTLRPSLSHRRRGRAIDLRCRQSRPLSRARALAYGEHPWHDDYIERSAGRRHHLDDHGGRRAGAALGRRLQPVLRGRPPAEVDVRAGGRLADRLARPRALVLSKPSAG